VELAAYEVRTTTELEDLEYKHGRVYGLRPGELARGRFAPPAGSVERGSTAPRPAAHPSGTTGPAPPAVRCRPRRRTRCRAR
jgi:hypothetical protein